MRKHTSTRNSGPDEQVKFIVSTNGKLKVSRCDAFDIEIFGCISCKFKDFCDKVFENGGGVDGGLASNTMSACL
jgi:hypothetical protein